MKKFITLIIALLILPSAYAEIIKAGISIDLIPKNLYGSWRIQAKLEKTNAPRTFKPQSLDFWDISRINNILQLKNTLNGANAEITIDNIEENLIVFTKTTPYDGNKILTDTVTIRLNGNKFSGINTLKLESFSLIDNHLIKTETALYQINGEKISGENAFQEENTIEPLNYTSF